MKLKSKLLLLPTLCLPLLLNSGCQTTPATVVGNSLALVGVTENGAMITAARAEANHTITEAQWQQISDAHSKFLPSYDAACSAAAVALDKATVPSDVNALEQSVLTLVATFIPNK